MTETLFDLLASADQDAEGLAWIGGSMSYRKIQDVVTRIAGQLASLGVNRGSRVAIVLPNGPAAALTLLAVTSCATATPLNPKYHQREFAFFLDDLKPTLLITGEDRTDLEGMEIPVAGINGQPDSLRLAMGGSDVPDSSLEFSEPDDIALVLHTSGTTSLPKQVPLTHLNLATSARNIAKTLQLGADDRCLNIMPLFHIHGMVGGLFSSLAAGGSVVCSPGFDAFGFRRWVRQTHPTWTTAVPTMYQLLLARANSGTEVSADSLRFLRSSSAPLPASVMLELEDRFGVPVIESYGMTEASHQMTSNPLPPGIRKPGSVGLEGATQVKVLLDSGAEAERGEEGEVVIRGASVTSGYHAAPEANATAFVNGWFRTGDSGRVDSDGYLYLTGRLKELINRGGTKISPRQIDEILLAHPDVEQAVAFAMPHKWLGEEVGAAVVVAPGSRLSEKELKAFVADSLSEQRMPKRLVFVSEIPKGPTGKLQRIGLAKTLGIS